ncbi:MAG: hypothetical protein ACLR8Y_15180 [Alistipes indistinctus]
MIGLYFMISPLSHTIENDDAAMAPTTNRLPISFSPEVTALPPLRMTSSAPPIPNTMPKTFIGVKPVDSEKERKTSTRIGPSVAMIDASMGLVCCIPIISSSFLAMPINSAAPDEFIDVVPVDFFDAAPKSETKTEQSRYCNGKRRQRDRRDVMGHQYLVKRIVDRPHQIGQQQAEMGPGHVL